MISDGYFRTMGIPILRGRDFTEREVSLASEPLRFIISRSMAEQYWPGEDPMGKKIVVEMKNQNIPGEIIGIVGDIRHYGLDAETHATVYYPHAQLQLPFMTFVVRTAADPAAAAPTVISAIRSLDPAQPLGAARPMDYYLAESMSRWRFEMVLLTVFAAVALLLASIGLYGVLATLVAQRVPELGVRIALGASSVDIFRLIVGRCLALAAGGIVLGVAVALLGSRVASSLLYSIKPTDPLTYAVVAGVLTVVSLAASYLPARRAMRVDPMTALRYE
jgi:predicted permease